MAGEEVCGGPAVLVHHGYCNALYPVILCQPYAEIGTVGVSFSRHPHIVAATEGDLHRPLQQQRCQGSHYRHEGGLILLSPKSTSQSRHINL
ncbi:MAG: hypothetical protein U5L72_12270 [Bacteroidales bacterium]|nr:hypothetical protein [Bacteroidales bacterium]